MRLRYALPFLAIALGACTDEDPISPTAVESEALFSCLLGEPISLEVGEVVQRSGAEAGSFCLGGGDNGAEYVFVPFFAADSGAAELAVEITGAGITGVGGEPNASLGPTTSLAMFSTRPQADEDFHLALRERERRELTSMMDEARAYRRAHPFSANVAADPPQLGELLTFNTTTACNAYDLQTGRVVAISDHAIVVADTSNPGGGFTSADYEFFAATFDTLVHPVNIENFGEPTDIDENGRSIIFFTRAVNELTPPNSESYVGGFFWAGDLFPDAETDQALACPGGNNAEMFYLLAPDPDGEINNNAFQTEFVRQVTVGVIGHEFQHLINASRRLYVNDAFVLEEVWLSEALSHIAEELLFYEVSGLSPRDNLDLDALRSSSQALFAVNTYQVSNLARYSTYLENPDEESLLGEDNLPTRGASWAFLRYTADVKEGTDAPFFFDVVNSRVAGIDNLQQVLDQEPKDLMQSWTVSVYTDDTNIDIPERFTQPSWDFRSVMQVFTEDGSFPLEVIEIESETETTLTLLGGGAAFVRFGVGANGRAILNTTSESEVPPDALRISIVRTN